MRVNGAWRAEDEALLARLEDQRLLEAAWARLAGDDAAPPHARAAGLIEALRAHPAGCTAVDRARDGELAPLLAAITQPDRDGMTPALAHHLALLHERLARVLEGRAEEARRAPVTRAWLTAMGMWLWLGEEGEYLRRMASTVVGAALSEEALVRAAAEQPKELLRTLGARASAGARELDESSRLALEALARVQEATTWAGLADDEARRIGVMARREREAAIDDAVARVDASLEEACLADAPVDDVAPLLWDGVAVWRWAERDELVERALIERITPYLWNRYRARQWPQLVSVLRPLEGPVDHLAHTIERDPTKLAYAAPCALMYVFRAETAGTLEGQIALAERATAICPTHRNGRLVLADMLVQRATRAMDRVAWLDTEAIARAKRDLARAEELYPQLKRLPEARARLEAKLKGRGDE